MQKINRKTAEEMLIKLSENTEEILNSGCIPEEKFVLYRNYIEAGNQMREYYCQECGTKYNAKIASPYTHQIMPCPTCGNKNSRVNMYVGYGRSSVRNIYYYAKPIENGFAVMKFTPYTSTSDDEELADVKNTVTIHVCDVVMFDNDSGWFVYRADTKKLLKRDSQDEISIIDAVSHASLINTPDFDFELAILNAKVFDKKRLADNEKRKANSKAGIIEDMRSSYRPKPVDLEKIAAINESISYCTYSQKGNKTEHFIGCGKCGNTSIVEIDGETIQCPVCGNSQRYTSWYSSSNSKEIAVVFENTNLPENDLLIRIFKVEPSLDIANGYQKNVFEYQRIFAGKKMSVYVVERPGYGKPIPPNAPFIKRTIRDVEDRLHGWRENESTAVIQSDEEIAQIIQNSCLAYSGLVESYGLGNKAYKGYRNAPSLSYLLAWYKNPAMEYVLKSNMITALEKYVADPTRLHTGKNLAEALGVSPRVAKIAAKLNPTYDAITDLSALYEADNNITQELFEDIKGSGVHVHNLIALKTTYDVPYSKALQYLQTVYDHQCIEKNEALGIWVDYLRMAKAIHIDLTDKTRLYPGSLKKEHDVAVFAYRAVQNEINAEQFKNQAEINAFYEYTYHELMVVIPRTPEQIVEEATRQKNCLRSYIERVKNGDTVVAFIRRKEFPDDTYVTVEINNGAMVQLKGYANSNPRNKQLMEFVEHWSKARGIRINC